MIRAAVTAGLACSTILLSAAPASAQDGASDATAAKIEALEDQVRALQEAIEGLKAAQAPNPVPSWKGAPQLEDKEAGWSFKPRGRLQYDAATVSAPEGFVHPGLGFSNELRRVRLGVEGTLPGNFGYRTELEFASGEAEIDDAYLSYQQGAIEIIVGHHNNFQSLEELTSDLHTSFIEKAAFTDAFGFEKRVGISAQYSRGPLVAQGGAFTDNIADLNTVGPGNNSYGFDGRLVFMPKLGAHQLHFAGSGHWRDINDAGTTVRYRQRPAVHTTDVRFIDTGNIQDSEREIGYGLEAAGIFGPFHVAGEAAWQRVVRGGSADPTFFGAYVEGGYFLTGETRGYKAGRFDRVRVKRAFSDGGWGALALNARWDFLDLTDAGIMGGRQNAFQASLNWKPSDFILFGLNVAHIRYDDAAVSAGSDRDYSVDTAAVRAQVDF